MTAPARGRVERDWDFDTPSLRITRAVRETLDSVWLDNFLEPPELPTVARKGDLLRTMSHGLAATLEPHETILLVVVGMAIRDASATKLSRRGGPSTSPTQQEQNDAREFLQGWRFSVWCRRFGADPDALRRALRRAGWWPDDLDGASAGIGAV